MLWRERGRWYLHLDPNSKKDQAAMTEPIVARALEAVDGDCSEFPIELPTEWEICPTCRGEGKHSLHIGAITASDRREWDPDDFDEYMRGGYDKRCDDCNGSGKVKYVDYDALPDALRVLLHDYYAQEEQAHQEREAERRAGC